MNGISDRLFLEFSAAKLEQLCSRVEACLAGLSGEQVWTRGGENGNAIGNLVLHLCGNVRQWIVSGLGERPDIRDRDAEFAPRRGVAAAELSKELRSTVDQASVVLRGFNPDRLGERVTIQGYHLPFLEAIYHVVEHFSMHTGQIIFATKLLQTSDLDFYSHLKTAGPHGQTLP